jgi:hypothetical protein
MQTIRACREAVQARLQAEYQGVGVQAPVLPAYALQEWGTKDTPLFAPQAPPPDTHTQLRPDLCSSAVSGLGATGEPRRRAACATSQHHSRRLVPCVDCVLNPTIALLRAQ